MFRVCWRVLHPNLRSSASWSIAPSRCPLAEDPPRSYTVLSTGASICWCPPQELQLPIKNRGIIFSRFTPLVPPCSARSGQPLEGCGSSPRMCGLHQRGSLFEALTLHTELDVISSYQWCWGEGRPVKVASWPCSERYYPSSTTLADPSCYSNLNLLKWSNPTYIS